MISKRSSNAGIKELLIFDYFQIDKSLPKYNNRNESTLKYESSNGMISVINTDTNGFGSFGSSDRRILHNEYKFKPPIKERIINYLLNLLQKSKEERNDKPLTTSISILEFFTSLSKSYKELTPIAEIAAYYQKALIQAKGMGQKALLEKLADSLDVIRGEAHLITSGLRKYVTEEQVIDFYEKVGQDKNLKLTWITNFARIIPEQIYSVKKDVDERKIFDNYVILHYDPENNGEKMTKEEVEKKKDPILFGVIENSRKLYYIGDWKDDYCELTLDEMFNELGGKVLKINNKTVKTYIDKIN